MVFMPSLAALVAVAVASAVLTGCANTGDSSTDGSGGGRPEVVEDAVSIVSGL